jgi:putative solute:sodium symporter small subunit
MAAQGSVLIFMGIVALYAWLMNRWETQDAATAALHASASDGTSAS